MSRDKKPRRKNGPPPPPMVEELTRNSGSSNVLGPGLSAKMPDTWVDQLTKITKDTLKQESKGIIWATIAGSSVLAAILGIAGDFVLVPYKARYETRLAVNAKVAELTLLDQNRILEKRRDAYDALDKELEKIGRTLRTYVSTCEQVKNEPGAKGYVAFAQSSWDDLTNQLGDVTNAKNACGKLNPDDEEIPKAVDGVLKILGPNLFSPAVKKNKEINPELSQALPNLDSSIDEIRKRINERKGRLVLTLPAN